MDKLLSFSLYWLTYPYFDYGFFPKETHRYVFAMVKAARTIPVDMAEKLDHIKQLRFNLQLKELRKRINRRIT